MSCMLWRRAGTTYKAFVQLGSEQVRLGIRSYKPSAIRYLLPENRSQSQVLHSEARSSAMSTSATPVRDSIQEKVSASLSPLSIDIKDESSQHAGHAAMKGLPSSETHFRLSIVSPEFEGLTTIKRHKLVYKVLAEELAGPIHALSLKTKAPSES